jgi:pyruvate/2-oxoglutarate dehydrogenase complex dihydrolipoamide dehydrogenase (E3) component
MTKTNLSFENFQRRFKQDIFPPDWVNPKPAEQYDLLVLGGGPGGMTGAYIAKSLGARVALVEKEHLGGECLNYGCIPSKAFLRSSRLAQEIRNALNYGVEIPQAWKVDFKKVMQRVYDLQTTLSPYDSAAYWKSLGIDVFLGTGRFTATNKVEVANQTIQFKKAIISTGTQPILLNVHGLDSSDYFTNQNIFSISTLPPRLGVIGGGPISCELSQGFLRFGSQVVLITHGERLLPKDDLLAAERIKNIFEKEGMKVFIQSNVVRVEKKGKEKILYLDTHKEPVVVDEILIGIGRKPVVDGMDLENAKVTYDKKTGISVNEYLQTSNPDIYAAGDVASPYKFTHMSVALNKMAAANALNGNREKSQALIVPWCTFTDPEIAHIGLNEEGAKNQKIAVESVTVEMKNVDRAILDGETTGFVKLLVKENSDQIVGGTIMATHAGEMISELGAAMNGEKGLKALLNTIHPFPTQASVLQIAAEAILTKRKELIHV